MGKTQNTQGIGAALEKVVFHKSIPLFKKGLIKTQRKKSSSQSSIELNEQDASIFDKFCWWEPSQSSLPVEFCRNSSIHGLSFIGKPKLHMSERIFWAVAFILGVIAAVFLINDVWERYYKNPVIVAFQAQEVDIDTIPFPSVTICSMNAFPKSEVKRLQKIAQKYGTDEAKEAREALKYVREICNSQLSFSKEFHFAHGRGKEDMKLGWNDTIAEDSQNKMINYLMKYTLPCESLIRLCMFAERPVNCTEIFKPLITDYGKCCTFNILPMPLLLNQQQPTTESTTEADKPSEDEQDFSQRWSEAELELWRSWNYDKDGFIMPNKSQPRPYRQKRAGMPYGLSLLVDPNLNDWYCAVSDSQGFRFVLHNSLEMPIVDEFASLIQLNQEIMVEVRPEMTNADDDIRDFPRVMAYRNCYFPEERQLEFFGPYTSGNCLAECTALELERQCNCTYFYMPRHERNGICNTDPESDDYKCTSNAKTHLLNTLKTQCKHCDSLCENIEYHFETTTASLQDPLKLWNDPDLHHLKGPPSWFKANNKMSIIHTYLGTETIVPKLRKRLYGTTDLIANTGGLLGLCLGFSILSAMEVVYFLTLRTFWHICWKRTTSRKNQHELDLLPVFTEHHRNHSTIPKERIIHLNPKHIPLVNYDSSMHISKNYQNVPLPYNVFPFVMSKKEY